MISTEELVITKCSEEKQGWELQVDSFWSPFPKSEGFWLWRRIFGVAVLLGGV